MQKQAPTQYANPYLKMDAPQPAQQPTEREYTYAEQGVIYHGRKAREMETTRSLYDSGDYEWAEAQQVARKLVETQEMERKLKAQDTILALGEHEAQLKQKAIANSMIENRQTALADLATLNTEDVVNFSKNIADWRNKHAQSLAFDDVVQKQATQKIKEQEFYATQMKNMLHASGVDAFVPEVLNENGSVNMSRASEVGMKMKQRELQMAEDAKAGLARKKALEARLNKELGKTTPAGAAERAARIVEETGGEAEFTEDGVKVKLTPSSAMQAKALKTQSEKEEAEARKKGLPTKATMQEAPKFNPNDMEAAKRFMMEKQREYELGEDASSAQTLIELARKRGFNIR